MDSPKKILASKDFLEHEYIRKAFFNKCLIENNIRSLEKVIDAGYNYSINKSQITFILTNNYFKLFKLILKKSFDIYVCDEIITLCGKNCSKKTLYKLLSRSECYETCSNKSKIRDDLFRNIADNRTILLLLSLQNFALNKRLLSCKKLDFEAEQQEIILYLCKYNKVDEITFILNTRYFNPDCNDRVFIFAAIKYGSHNVVELFKSRGLSEDNEKTAVFSNLMKVGGI